MLDGIGRVVMGFCGAASWLDLAVQPVVMIRMTSAAANIDMHCLIGRLGGGTFLRRGAIQTLCSSDRLLAGCHDNATTGSSGPKRHSDVLATARSVHCLIDGEVMRRVCASRAAIPTNQDQRSLGWQSRERLRLPLGLASAKRPELSTDCGEASSASWPGTASASSR